MAKKKRLMESLDEEELAWKINHIIEKFYLLYIMLIMPDHQ